MGPFIHRIDPVICDIGGVYLWWYGLSFTLGFSGIHFWFRRMRNRLGLSLVEVYDVSLALSVGVLLGGRLVEVFFYEWEYYGAHLGHIPAVWLGGMSTHGLLLGGTLGTLFFCWRRRVRRLRRDYFPGPGAVLPVPLHHPGKALVKTQPGLPAQQHPGLADIRPGVLDVGRVGGT